MPGHITNTNTNSSPHIQLFKLTGESIAIAKNFTAAAAKGVENGLLVAKTAGSWKVSSLTHVYSFTARLHF